MSKICLSHHINKTLTRGNTRSNRGAGIEEKIIQRLPHQENHPICSHQTQTLLLMPRSVYWQEPDMDVSSEALPLSYTYRWGCLQLSIRLKIRTPMKELEKGLKELKGLQPHGKNNIINQPRHWGGEGDWQKEHLFASKLRGRREENGGKRV